MLEKGKPAGSGFRAFRRTSLSGPQNDDPEDYDDPMIYAGLDGKQSQRSERWWEANMVGGSTMVWDANFPRYTPEDFDVLPYLKGCPTRNTW